MCARTQCIAQAVTACGMEVLYSAVRYEGGAVQSLRAARAGNLCTFPRRMRTVVYCICRKNPSRRKLYAYARCFRGFRSCRHPLMAL